MADFTPDAIGRIQRVVPYVERSMRNTLPRRARWHGGGGGGKVELEIRHFELKTDLAPSYDSAALKMFDPPPDCAFPLDDGVTHNGLPESWMDRPTQEEDVDRFVLGSCAIAHRLNMDHDHDDDIPVGEPIIDDDLDFKVHDWTGQFRGRGRLKYDFPYHRGSRGIAVWVPKHEVGLGKVGFFGLHRGLCCPECNEWSDASSCPCPGPEGEECGHLMDQSGECPSCGVEVVCPNKRPTRGKEDQEGQWHIFQMTPHATKIMGKSIADYPAHSEIGIDGVRILQPTGAIFVTSDPKEDEMMVLHPFGFPVDMNGWVIADFDDRAGLWIVTQVQCPSPDRPPIYGN